MDQRNNGIVARERPALKTWEDVVRWARTKIKESASHDGDGEEGRALWLEKQPAGWHPDFENVPITPIDKGGPEHRFGAQVAGVEPGDAPVRTAAAHPLERPVETWSEQDVRAVLSSPAYLERQHPRREQTHRLVRAWFERRFGAEPAQVDATGRPVRKGETIASSGGTCPVAVRAHTRQGGKIEVAAHCRTTPAA